MLLNQRHSYLLKKAFFIPAVLQVFEGWDKHASSWGQHVLEWPRAGWWHLWASPDTFQGAAAEGGRRAAPGSGAGIMFNTRVLCDHLPCVSYVERYLNLHFWSVLIYISTLNTSTTLKPLVLLASYTSFLSPFKFILCLHIAHFAHNYFQPHTYCKVQCSISFF